MGKLVIACLMTVLLGGAAMFLAGSKVGPAVGTKAGNLNTSISTATVNQTSGTVTATAP
ncbi:MULTISPECIES: hypothetical protein [Paenibacillus]|uniref:Uncharacterized protein n=3 Tax=Paenibacillus mucilaginosus TaxID=61624 RepID=H6N9A0_9BACL|nr:MULTISPECIES: hypothetical protein [Paenibacillus]AEI39604.1 hypothetical protein KNP414_01014 [Paenibacillus mucilaginosus KNP414]AFC27846.1 hypothetical protein PM3016_902 [Paenibacillus mucilaginosus 3016]MCG7218024.1 hypothetical protein [Paenibacillus mucilaginosus]MCZ8523487.1 hypothetical protein [Paenibacillus caseinilyticus]WDM28548.1 hypothetical protein KCX80_04700 [Paenibacillus mucilaginosus]